MVVAQGNALCLFTIGIEGDEGGWLWRRKKVTPMVKAGRAEIDRGKLLSICCD
jgi:hypothetical protein